MSANVLMRMAIVVAILFGFAAAAVAQTPPANPTTQSAPSMPPVQNVPSTTVTAPSNPNVARESYQIGQGDVLEIAVVGREDYKARVQVQDDGTIQLPLIGNVQAVGRTILELRESVRTSLRGGGFYVDPAINVTVVNFASRYVTVLGQVNTPGIVPIDRAYRLSEIIARVGGLSSPSITTVTVTGGGGQSKDYRIADIATGGPAQDPFVSDGDKIFVAPAKTFYIYGQVNAPGTYPIDPGMSLRMALARAGGLTNLGSERRVRVIRGEQEFKRFNLSDPLLEGDVVVVGERFF